MEFQSGVSNNISQIFNKGKKSSGKAVKVTLEEDRAIIEVVFQLNMELKYWML